jgi:hypothetical protein
MASHLACLVSGFVIGLVGGIVLMIRRGKPAGSNSIGPFGG